MDLDKRRGYAWKAGLLIFTSGFVGACAANSPVMPSVTAEGPTSTSIPQSTMVIDTPMATFTSMPDDPILSNLVSPEMKATSAVATANAVGTPEGLVAKDNFPEKILKSQRPINITARFFFNVDGGGWYDDLDYPVGMAGTLVKDSRYPNKIFYVTAGHGFDFALLKESEEIDLQAKFGNKKVDFTNLVFPQIVIDGQVFTNDQYGLDHAYVYPNTAIGVDRAVIAVDQQNVPAEVWAKWMADAISTEDITYAPNYADQKYFGVCNSASADNRLVVGENMTFIREYGNFVAISPYTASYGCSGSAVGSRIESPPYIVEDELMGINVGFFASSDNQVSNVIQVYSFADWTQAGFEASMLKAVGANNDGLLRQINATPTPISP